MHRSTKVPSLQNLICFNTFVCNYTMPKKFSLLLCLRPFSKPQVRRGEFIMLYIKIYLYNNLNGIQHFAFDQRYSLRKKFNENKWYTLASYFLVLFKSLAITFRILLLSIVLKVLKLKQHPSYYLLFYMSRGNTKQLHYPLELCFIFSIICDI